MLGSDLANTFLKAAWLIESPYSKDNVRKLASLRQWMGPKHYSTLVATVNAGMLSATAVNKSDVPASIIRARDAIVLVHEWIEERPKWGLD
jgi:hypothetical protein